MTLSRYVLDPSAPSHALQDFQWSVSVEFCLVNQRPRAVLASMFPMNTSGRWQAAGDAVEGESSWTGGQTAWPWACTPLLCDFGQFLSLSVLCFFICKMGIIIVSTSWACTKDQMSDAVQHLRQCLTRSEHFRFCLTTWPQIF